MPMSKKLIIGNWKMNPTSLGEAKRIARDTRARAATLDHVEVVACPPAAFLAALVSRGESAHFHLGAQSVSMEEGGPHTGEIGADMLRSMDVEYVIVGHSEERSAGDTDETVSRKALRVLESGMTAVVCVGEKERTEEGAHFDFLKSQIRASLAGIPENKVRSIVIAYEPVWAIGAKEAMAAPDIYEMSLFVKKAFADAFGPEAGLKAKILYGGSVNFRNAREIMTIGKVDGLLVGRESVNMPGFSELLKAVDEI